jgi:phage terminase small subunit
LTHKQKAFAEEIAKGATKAGAYKKAYTSKGTSHTRSREGSKLLDNPQVSTHVDQIKLAIEAQKYLFPAHLRALAIQQLTEKALDPSIPPAIQVRCLELIGKMSDVALFQERKEIQQTATTSEAKSKLISSLAEAIRSSRSLSMDKKQDAEDLLREITGDDPITIDQLPTIETEEIEDPEDHSPLGHLPADPETEETAQEATPPTPTPQNSPNSAADTCHSNPLKQSHDFTETPPFSFTDSEWGGGTNFWEQFEEPAKETPPVIDSGSPTTPVDTSNPNWKEA